MYKSSVRTDFAKQIMLILHILCYNSSLVTWSVMKLTTAKFKPLIFSVSVFILSYTANMFILMILYDFCLFPAQFCYVIIYVWKVENRMQTMDWCWRYLSQSQSYVTTDGQSASLSWNEAPVYGLRPDLYYCQTVRTNKGNSVASISHYWNARTLESVEWVPGISKQLSSYSGNGL
jgi:hypothetical protein